MDPRVPRWSPRVSKFSPKATKSCENLQHAPQGSHNGAPGATMEPQGPHKYKTKHKKLTQIATKTSEGAPRSKKTTKKPYRHRQPTNQRNKEKHIETNKQSNKPTQELRTANTNTNSRGRVLAEGDVDPPRCSHPHRRVLGHLR